MALYGVGLDITIRRVISDLKDYIIRKKGSVVVGTLRDIFEEFDLNGNKKLDISEFEKGLGSFGFFPKKVDLQALMTTFDLNKDGLIDFEEFLRALQEPLNPRRLKMVKLAFDSLPRRDSSVYMQEKINQDPKIQDGFDKEETKLKKSLIKQFLKKLVTIPDPINEELFRVLHNELSFSIASDQVFVKIIEDLWGVYEEGDLSFIKEESKRLLSKINIKLKELTKENDKTFLKKFFASCDVKKRGYLGPDELALMLRKLDLNAPPELMPLIFNEIDSNNSNTIEFEEFEMFSTY